MWYYRCEQDVQYGDHNERNNSPYDQRRGCTEKV